MERVQGEYRESTGRARERHAARREECMLAIKADCVCLMELYVETFLPVAQVNENKGRWKEGRKEMRRIQIQSSIDFILSVQSALSALSALSYSVALRCISERL